MRVLAPSSHHHLSNWESSFKKSTISDLVLTATGNDILHQYVSKSGHRGGLCEQVA